MQESKRLLFSRAPQTLFRSLSTRAMDTARLLRVNEARCEEDNVEIVRGVRWPDKELRRIQPTPIGGMPTIENCCGTLFIDGISQLPMSYDNCNGVFFVMNVAKKKSVMYILKTATPSLEKYWEKKHRA